MIPLFPKYKESRDKNIFTLKSNIYLHKDAFSFVEVYTYTVESSFILEKLTQKASIREAHLKECLRMSKYLDISSLEEQQLSLVDTLDKTSEDFLCNLHYQYP
jgi:hypothetical protein